MASRTTTRADLLEAVHSVAPTLSRAEAKAIVKMALDEICDALVQGDRVKLRAFGSFTVRSKGSRVGRNPRTGEEHTISARRVLTFHPSPRLIAAVNGLAEPDESDDD